MKNLLFKSLLFSMLFVGAMSCTTEEESSQTTTGGSSSSSSRTTVNLTARTSNNMVRSNYQLMMFDQQVDLSAALPPIILESTTDANGLAIFDLDALVTGTATKTYYFEAFTRTASGDLVLKSITHPVLTISRGEIRTTSILVN